MLQVFIIGKHDIVCVYVYNYVNLMFQYVTWKVENGPKIVYMYSLI